MRLTPSYFFLNYTTLCHSRCTTCRLWAGPEVTLPVEQLQRIGRFFDPQKVREVYFTGGEPLLPGSAVEMAVALERWCPGVTVTGATNSMYPILYLRRVAAMQAAGVRIKIIVSLNGPPATHDRTRGILGNYERVLEMAAGLKELRALLAVNLLEIPGETTGDDRGHVLAVARRYRVPLWHSPILRKMPWFGVADDGATVPEIANCRGGGEVLVILPNGDITACQEPKPQLRLGNLGDEALDPSIVTRVQETVRNKKCQPCGCCTPAFSHGIRCAT
jgi:MoaA/NifB/PqqE/SkfB family radical SAM enzyme